MGVVKNCIDVSFQGLPPSNNIEFLIERQLLSDQSPKVPSKNLL